MSNPVNPVDPHEIPGQPAHGVETYTNHAGRKICNICGKAA